MEITQTAVGCPAAARGIAAEEFDELVRLHQRRIYRVVLFMVRDPDAAGTLTQECFLRAYRTRAGFRGQSSVETWLIRIAINLARDSTRSRRWQFWRRLVRVPERPPDVADLHASPEALILAREEIAAVWSAVDLLPAQQRSVFLLRFVEELRLEEIAEALSLEVGTVKAHLYRALAAVRERRGGSRTK